MMDTAAAAAVEIQHNTLWDCPKKHKNKLTICLAPIAPNPRAFAQTIQMLHFFFNFTTAETARRARQSQPKITHLCTTAAKGLAQHFTVSRRHHTHVCDRAG